MKQFFLSIKKLNIALKTKFLFSIKVIVCVVIIGITSEVKGQLTANWQGPFSSITIQATKKYFIVDWLDTVSLSTMRSFVSNSVYPLDFPDTNDIPLPKIGNRIKIKFDVSSGPVSDSTYTRCFRYFRDSLGPDIKSVFSTYSYKGQTYEETEWVLVRLNQYSDTLNLKLWVLSNDYVILRETFFSRVYLLERKSYNKKTNDNAALSLAGYAWVEFSEPLHNIYGIQSFVPNDTYYSSQWYLQNTGSNCPSNSTGCTADADIDIEGGWDQVKGCDKVKIGVSDDGIQIGHKDLLCDSGFNCYYESPLFPSLWTANVKPWDRAFFLNRGNRYVPNKDGTHGTLCSGIAGAVANNSIGIAGVGNGVSIEPYKIVTNSGANPLILAATYKYGVDSGDVDVMSCSWAISVPYSIIKLSIDYAISHGRNGLGMAIVHSTGNTLDDPCSAYGILFPASYNPVIATTGSTSCDKLKTCSGDCSGETDWGAYYGPGTDVAAPCHGILTTDIEGAGGRTSADYFEFNGTSSAVPQVSGLLGLIFSINPFLTLEQARSALESTCDKVGGYSYNVTSGQPNGTWSNELGYGRINSDNAILAAHSNKVKLFFSQGTSLIELNSNIKHLFNPSSLPYQLKVICPNERILNLNYNVTWFRNGIQVSSGTNLYTLLNPKPGRYTAIINATCPNSFVIFTDEVEIKYECNAIGYDLSFENGQVINTAFNLINTSPVVYFVGSDIEITASGIAQFSNCKFVFSNCSKLIINGGILNAINCEFVSCDKWSGIYQDYSNSNVTLTNCLIEDATVAFSKHSEGTLGVFSCEFGINFIHSIIENTVPTSVHTINISNNKFGELLDNGNFNIACPFYFSNYATYPLRYNTYLSVYNSTNMNVIGNVFYSKVANTFLTALYSKGMYSQKIEANMFFGFFDTSISLYSCEGGTIASNEILKEHNVWTLNHVELGSIGILSKNSLSLTIKENNFRWVKNGIEYYSRRVGSTWIKYNVFNNLDFGIVSATNENPVTASMPYNNASSGFLVDVQTRCNDFFNCSYGWVGTGEHAVQGTMSLATGNKFYNTQNWNVIVAYGSDYHSPFGNTIENPYTYQLGNLSMDGVNYNSGTYGPLCFNNAFGLFNSCSGSSPSIDTEEPVKSILSEIFPNPFSETLNLQFEADFEYIQISDMSGRLEIEYREQALTKVTLYTADLSQGTKLIRVVFTDGTIATYKAIKL
jgi:hypothetical protein